MAPNRIPLSPLQVENIKRAATKRKRATPELTHSEALDQLATEHGFANWSLLAKATNQVKPSPGRTAIPRNFEVRVSGWVIPERQVAQFWHVNMPSRYPEKHYRGFRRIPEYWDVKRRSFESTLTAMEQLRMNVAFMDATELLPSKAFVSLFPDFGQDAGLDHHCVWRTADAKYVVSNEPYRGSSKREGTKRWCEANGWSYRELPKSIGMHNTCSAECPDDCTFHTALILMSPPKKGADVDLIADRLIVHFEELNAMAMGPEKTPADAS